MVLSLTIDNIESNMSSIKKMTKAGNTLVFVHAHWCPYTVAFYGTWRKVKTNLAKSNPQLNIIEIDDQAIGFIRDKEPTLYKKMADYSSELGQYKLYFPTVMLFTSGKRTKYEDERTVANVVAFVSSAQVKHVKSVKPVKPVKSVKPVKPVKPTKSLQKEIDKAFRRLLK